MESNKKMKPLRLAFQICDKEKTLDFYTNILKMSILEGSEAPCDVIYDKTKVIFQHNEIIMLIKMKLVYVIKGWLRY